MIFAVKTKVKVNHNIKIALLRKPVDKLLIV